MHGIHCLLDYMHVFIPTYMYACIHCFLHCMHVFINTWHAFIHACIHCFLHCMHAFISTYMHGIHCLLLHACIYFYIHACMHVFINNWHAFIHAWHSLVIILHACIYSYVVLSATCTRTRQAMRRSLWAFFVPDIAVKNCDVSTSALHIHTQTPPSNVDLTHISLKQDGAVLDGALTTSRYKFWSVLSKLYKSQIDNSVDHDDFIVDNSSFLIK